MISKFAKKHLTKIFDHQMVKIINKHNPKIVAIAGSVGKTTTKLAVATMLSQAFKVQYQDGNYNTPISIPLIFTGQTMPSIYNPFSWLGVWLRGQKVLKNDYPYDIVVVELGVDAPGDMGIFKKIIHPDVSIITAVCEEHMEFFKTLDAVAKEELLLTTFTNVYVFNQEDIDKNYLDKYVPNGVSVRSYGVKDGQYTIKANKTDFTISTKTSKGNIENTKAQSINVINLKAICAAVVVADIFEMNNEDIKKGINLIKPIPGRMQQLKGIKNSTILDDTYNSSPLAVEAALDTLYEFDAPQKIAILGTMNELGDYSKEAHERVGDYCSAQQIDLLVTIGDQANKYLADKAGNKGMPVIRCKSPYEAGRIVKKELKEGAVILAKGSQNGVFAEETVKILLANKEDQSKLVRQTKFWLNKKKVQFKDYN